LPLHFLSPLQNSSFAYFFINALVERADFYFVDCTSLIEDFMGITPDTDHAVDASASLTFLELDAITANFILISKPLLLIEC
jgi:hypothetical protein